MVRSYVKKPKIQCDDKEIQHGLQLINDGASVQMELDLSRDYLGIAVFIGRVTKREAEGIATL